MQNFWLNAAAICALSSGLSGFAGAAQLEEYPNRPVRFVVPFPPGGANDILARILGQKLSESLAQHFVLDNRAGASGIIGTALVSKTNPDGYTILMTGAAFAVLPSLYPKLQFNPGDLTPVSLVAVIPNILIVHPTVPVASVKEVIALAKAKPGYLQFAGAGVGGSVHLAGELFKSMARIDIVHVPYKGGPPALNDLLGGHVHMMFPDTLAAMPHVRAGKAKPLGITTAKRLAALPTVPAISETVPGYESAGWYGVLAPAGTPPAIVNKLSDAIAKALRSPDVVEKLSAQSAEPIGSTPQAFGAHIKSEHDKWAKVIREAGIKAD